MTEESVDEPTIGQIIDGFRYGPFGGIEERAEAIASYFSRSPKVMVAVERIDGTVAHFAQHTLIEDVLGWHLRGRLGDPYRFEISRFEIDLAPQNTTQTQ